MELEKTMFFGVIGNFAGHLEQAKEASEFSCEATHPDAPKGIFPIYIPNHESYLGRFCVSDEMILDGDYVQIEPEVAIDFEVIYAPNGQICKLIPHQIAAFNDGSKRIKAPTIAEKKNFSTACKGLGNWLPFEGWEALSKVELCSYLRRGSEWREYGKRRSANNYCYFGNCLVDWLIDRLNGQKAEGILSEIAPLVASCKASRAVICIGATPYTDYGDGNYLRSGDELFVAISPEGSNCDYTASSSEKISCLKQIVR